MGRGERRGEEREGGGGERRRDGRRGEGRVGKKRDEGSKSEKEVGEKKREGRKVSERKIREGGRTRHTLLTSCHCGIFKQRY